MNGGVTSQAHGQRGCQGDDGAGDAVPPLVRAPCLRASEAGRWSAERVLPEEAAVALVFDGAAQAVMMATPADLEDFVLGFALSEAIVAAPTDIVACEIVPGELGIEARAWLAAPQAARHAGRRRALAGPVGCGLCGVESLAEALRPPPAVAGALTVSPAEIAAAVAALPGLQWLNQEARAVHAAAFWRPAEGIVALREDVGRHNALDKLAGALARRGLAGEGGMVLITSRVSVEMVQKTARLGAPVLAAVSAPTALAVRTAEACGLTLIALARGHGFEVFTHPERVAAGAAAREARPVVRSLSPALRVPSSIDRLP